MLAIYLLMVLWFLHDDFRGLTVLLLLLLLLFIVMVRTILIFDMRVWRDWSRHRGSLFRQRRFVFGDHVFRIFAGDIFSF